MNGPDAQADASKLRRRRHVRPLVLLLLLVGALAIALTGMDRLRQIAREQRCRRDLRYVCTGLDLYRHHNDHYPPPYLTDDRGRPVHSWRILLMSYMVNEVPFDYGVRKYKFDEAWDGPNNKRFATGAAREFFDFSCPIYAKGSHSAYCLCVVGGALWPVPKKTGECWKSSTRPYPTEGGILPRVGKALLLVEPTQSDIPWTQPTDISLSELVALLRDDPGGARFRQRIRRVAAVDSAGMPTILDPESDMEQIKAIVASEAAGKPQQEPDKPTRPQAE